MGVGLEVVAGVGVDVCLILSLIVVGSLDGSIGVGVG